jgi:alpha-D-ribose 1-methylphosphonate 5-triphosphate diphosphatase
MSSREFVVHNARIVTRDEVIPGSLMVRDGKVRRIDRGASGNGSNGAPGEDWGGDLLLPGLVELHTDNLEKHILPRPGVWWPILSALMSHDAQLATAGITTVLDALAVGDPNDEGVRARMLNQSIEGLEQATAERALRIDHLLHLRCELASKNLLEDLEPHLGNPRLRLLSLMDHTPGQRQWIDPVRHKQFYQGRHQWSDEKLDEMIALQKQLQQEYAAKNRRSAAAMAQARGLVLASHDDTTAADVAEAVADGVTISEFPTTVEAATLARGHEMGIIAGGPNLVRGQSHSGNVSALDLAGLGLLDAISSDYMPSSLLTGAFRLHRERAFPLPAAVATVSRNPARMVGLVDRGEMATGLRADFIRVRDQGEFPLVRSVYLLGERIA